MSHENLDPHCNAERMLPINQGTIFIQGLGNVAVTSNNDFDPEPVLHAMFDSQGRVVDLPHIGGRVYGVPGRNAVVRQQGVMGSIESLQSEVLQHAQEMNMLRGYGLTVVRHASVIIPVSNIHNSEDTIRQPSVITIAQKLIGQSDRTNFDINNPANSGKLQSIVGALQAYYTHDITRKHISDINGPHQYSSDGQLMDLDMLNTEVVDGPITSDYPTCGEQLRQMYREFELTDEQIEELKRRYDIRSRIDIKNPNKQPDRGSRDDQNSDAEAAGLLSQLIQRLNNARSLTEGAARGLQSVEELARAAANLVDATIDGNSHVYYEARQTCNLFHSAGNGAEGLMQVLNNLADLIAQIQDRLLNQG